MLHAVAFCQHYSREDLRLTDAQYASKEKEKRSLTRCSKFLSKDSQCLRFNHGSIHAGLHSYTYELERPRDQKPPEPFYPAIHVRKLRYMECCRLFWIDGQGYSH
jgi:hypothetical protein